MAPTLTNGLVQLLQTRHIKHEFLFLHVKNKQNHSINPYGLVLTIREDEIISEVKDDAGHIVVATTTHCPLSAY